MEEAKESLVSMDRQGFLGVLREAIQYGSPGEARRIPVELAELNDRVILHQGVPTIARATGLRSLSAIADKFLRIHTRLPVLISLKPLILEDATRV